MSNLTLKTPADLDDLVRCLHQADASTYILGGGTDLVIRMRDRGINQGTLIDLTGVAGLDAITIDDDFIKIGANVTYSSLGADPRINALVPCLAQMANHIGSLQIRNSARLPGNIANASPAGDSIANLMALDASVHILDGQGQVASRKIAQVVTGIGKTILKPGEVIIAVQIPHPGPFQRSRYGKIGLGARSEVVIANVSLTLVLDFPPDQQRITRAQVVLGSAAPLAYHATNAEALLTGKRPSEALAVELAEALRAHVETSIKGVPMFLHKMNDVQGLAIDMFTALFSDLL